MSMCVRAVRDLVPKQILFWGRADSLNANELPGSINAGAPGPYLHPAIIGKYTWVGLSNWDLKVCVLAPDPVYRQEDPVTFRIADSCTSKGYKSKN